jgi:hypothetical protein
LPGGLPGGRLDGGRLLDEPPEAAGFALPAFGFFGSRPLRF